MNYSPDTRRMLMGKAGESARGLLGILNTREQALVKITKSSHAKEDHMKSFDQTELDQFYSAFLKASRDGKVATLAEFSQVFTAMGITDPTIIESTFRAWDLNGDGTLDFREFMSALSVLAKGTVDEKYEMVFRMFDSNKSGSVSRDDMEKMLTSISAVQGAPLESSRVKQIVSDLFAKLKVDLGHETSKVTFDDFKDFANAHSEMVKLFKVEDLVAAMQRSHIHEDAQAHKAAVVSQVQISNSAATTNSPVTPIVRVPEN